MRFVVVAALPAAQSTVMSPVTWTLMKRPPLLLLRPTLAPAPSLLLVFSGGIELEALPVDEPEALRDITKEQATEEIRTLFSEGEIIYMSDVAERLNLPDELVVEICLELAADGELNRRDNP